MAAAAAPPNPAAAVPDRKQALYWSAAEVMTFIRSISPAFGPYAEAMENEGVTGRMLLSDIDDEWLNANVKSPTHRKTIKREIEELNSKGRPALGTIEATIIGHAAFIGKGLSEQSFREMQASSLETAKIAPRTFDMKGVTDAALAGIKVKAEIIGFGGRYATVRAPTGEEVKVLAPTLLVKPEESGGASFGFTPQPKITKLYTLPGKSLQWLLVARITSQRPDGTKLVEYRESTDLTLLAPEWKSNGSKGAATAAAGATGPVAAAAAPDSTSPHYEYSVEAMDESSGKPLVGYHFPGLLSSQHLSTCWLVTD